MRGMFGSFSVFGHGDCFGDEGHCDVRDPVTAFDRRPPHQLVPTTRVLVATEAVHQYTAAGHRSVHVTAIAEVRPSALADADSAVGGFVDQVALHTYSWADSTSQMDRGLETLLNVKSATWRPSTRLMSTNQAPGASVGLAPSPFAPSGVFSEFFLRVIFSRI